MKKKPVSPTAAKKSFNKNKLGIFLGAIVILGIVVLGKSVIIDAKEANFKNKIIPDAIKKVLGNNKTAIKIANLKDVNGVYEFQLTLGENANTQPYTSYITKDGKILFTSGIKLETLDVKAATNNQNQQTKKLTAKDLIKAEIPELTAFVVSQCPYGLQMQRVFKKAIAELPQLEAYLNIKYIGTVADGKITSMHGDEEAQENLKQICIRQEQKDKYLPYISCYIQEGKSEECNLTTGVDANQIQSCVTDKNRGLAYAQKDFDLANKLNIGSSPTLVLNNKQTVSEFDFGGRVADALKAIVCGSADNKLGFCSDSLSKDEVAVSFSATDNPSETGTTTNSANCDTQ